MLEGVVWARCVVVVPFLVVAMKKPVVVRKIPQDTRRNYVVMMLCGHLVDSGARGGGWEYNLRPILRFDLAHLPRLAQLSISLSLATQRRRLTIPP